MSSIEARHSFTSEVTTREFRIILNFINFSQSGIKEYRTEKSLTDFRPQLKMLKFGSNGDLIENYFLSPIRHARLSWEVKICSDKPFTLSEKWNENVDPNRWYFLGQLLMRDIRSNYDNKYLYLNCGIRKLCLNIKFKIFEGETSAVTNLSSDLTSLFNNGLYSDMIIKSNEGKEYKVHKAILGGRSVVLKAHFEHDFIEKQTDIVEAPFDTEVLDEVISYMYSDKVPRLGEIPDKILAAADYYQLAGLKSLCSLELRKQLSADNAMKTFELASLYRDNSLKEAITMYIRNGFGGLGGVKSWEDALSVQLVKSIYLDGESDASLTYVKFTDD